MTSDPTAQLMKPLNAQFDLVIFDMDDTLVRAPVHWRPAEERLFRDLGREFSTEFIRKCVGRGAHDVGRLIHDLIKPDSPSREECGAILHEYVIESARDCTPQPMQGAAAILSRIKIPKAVASGSPLGAVEHIMAKLGWTHHFELMLSGEDVPKGKPAPDVFLKVAEMLDVPPHRILVFEDSIVGAQAAKAAGMTCYAIPFRPQPGIEDIADAVLSSFDEIV